MTLEQLQELQQKLVGLCPFRVHIAGGAVRDVLFGKPVKDIDVFIVRSREEDQWEEAEQRMSAKRLATLLEAESFTITSESGYPDGEQVYATYDLGMKDGPRINLIYVEDFAAALNEFPDTISQVYLDDEGDLVYSGEFRAALVGNSNQVLTWLPPDNKRVRRLSEKYGSMEWVIVRQDDPRLTEWAV